MADTSTSMDVEDVLSSIRRLVSEEAKGPAPKEKLVLSNPAVELEETPDFPDDVMPDEPTDVGDDLHDPLVLTPALQVVSTPDADDDDLDDALDHALLDDGDTPDTAFFDNDQEYPDDPDPGDPVDVMVEAPDADPESEDTADSGTSRWSFASGLRNRRKGKKETPASVEEEPLTVRRRTPRPAAISLEELIEETTGRAAVSGHERLRRKKEAAEQNVVVPLAGDAQEPMAFDDQAELDAEVDPEGGAADAVGQADSPDEETAEITFDEPAIETADEEEPVEGLVLDTVEDDGAASQDAVEVPADDAAEIVEPQEEQEEKDWSAVLATAMSDAAPGEPPQPEVTASGKSFEPMPDDIWDRARNVAAQQGADPMLTEDGQPTASVQAPASPQDDMVLPEGALDPRPAETYDDVAEANAGFAEDAVMDPADADDADDGFIDEDALRDMVVAILREELRGELGDRITHNVRKLVRREINRALTAQDFE